MLGTGAVAVGALVGLAIGVALSVYVAMLDMRKRAGGARSRAQYRGSLVVVPGILAVIGGLIGVGMSHLG
jgi:hypothetical protein